MEEELQITKKTIRSLLISVKEGLTVRELENDFIEFEGTKLPFAKFGFQNARAFLQSLSDVVHFFRDQNGEEKMKQVSDASTIHIEKLVARQKSDTKKKKSNKTAFNRQTLQNFNVRGRRGGGNVRGGRQPFRGRPQPLGRPHGGQQGPRPWPNNQNAKGTTKVSPPPLLSIPLPPEVGGLQSNPSGSAALRDLNKNTMKTSMHNEKVYYVADLEREGYKSQNNMKMCKTKKDFEGVHLGTAGTIASLMSPSKPGLMSAQDPYVKSGSNGRDSDWAEGQRKGQTQSDLDRFSAIEEDCVINQGVQQKVRQVLAKAPRGLWAKRLPVMYKQMFSQELPLKESGFHSVIEFVSEMLHVVRIERPYENGDWLLSDATMPRQEAEEVVNRHQQMVSQINQGKKKSPAKSQPAVLEAPFRNMEEFKESVRQVLQHQTDGVKLDLFPEVYEDMTGHRLDPRAYGHEDMLSLLLSLAEQEVLTWTYDDKKSTRLVGVCKSGLRRFDLLKDAYKPHANHDRGPEQHNTPEGVVGPGRCYPPAVMDEVVRGGTCEVHVSSVVSPSLFWVQKRSGIAPLDDLMDALEAEYSANAGNYRMPSSLMVHGQVCAALFDDNNWHRAIITGTSASKVTVYYVDYGNSCAVDPATICFLTEKFLSLPVQAMQARLAFVLPLEGKKAFSKEAKQELFKMVVQRPIQAYIADIKNLVLSTVLVDTSKAEDVVINDELVNKGLARFIPEDVNAKGEAEELASAAVTRQDDARSSTPFYGEGRRYVRLLEFSPDIEFHVVYFGGEVSVLSSQISRLFWEDDCLAFMLQQQNMVLQKLVMSRLQSPALFEELSRRGAFFAGEETKLLNLYRLESLPLLVDMFGDQSQRAEELKVFITRYLDSFDHNDPYWKGADEETVSVGASEGTGEEVDGDVDPEDILTMEELQMALHSMQINRKRILRRMSSEPECMLEVVKELESTEDSIQQIQELLQALEQSRITDLKLPASGKSVPSSTDCSVTVAPQPKGHTSCMGRPPSQEQRGGIKTNVVTPMVKPPPAPTPPAVPAASATPLPTDLLPESLELMADNRRLEEEIRQKEKIISSMLGGAEAGVGLMGGGMGPLSWGEVGGVQHVPAPRLGGPTLDLPLTPAALPYSRGSARGHVSHNPQRAELSGHFRTHTNLGASQTTDSVSRHFAPDVLQAQCLTGVPSDPSCDLSMDCGAGGDVKPGLLPLPTVGVVRPHLATSAPAPAPVQAGVPLLPTPQPPAYRLAQPISTTGLLPHPTLPTARAPPPAAMPRMAPAALQQQFLQLQQKHQAVVMRQQAMSTTSQHTPALPMRYASPATASDPAVVAGSVFGREDALVVGGESGEGQLLPEMLPLLHRFQESCAVQPLSTRPVSSSARSVSQ